MNGKYEYICKQIDKKIHDLAIPALRELSPSQYAAFKANVEELIKADRTIDLFEWTLQRILLHHLAPEFERARAARVKYGSVKRVVPHCQVVLSTLARAGHRVVEIKEVLDVKSSLLKE